MDNSIIAATGDRWIRYGVRSIYGVIRDMVENADKCIVMTAFILSEMTIVDAIRHAVERGISVEIYIYKNDEFNNTDAFRAIIDMKESNNFKNLSVFLIPFMLHAKVLVVDYQDIFIGSANPTFGGMISNYELGVRFTDTEKALKIVDLLREVRQ